MKNIILRLMIMSIFSMGLRAPGYENRISKITDFDGQMHELNIPDFEALVDFAIEKLGGKKMPIFIYGSSAEGDRDMQLVQNDADFSAALWHGGSFKLMKQKQNEQPRKKKCKYGCQKGSKIKNR